MWICHEQWGYWAYSTKIIIIVIECGRCSKTKIPSLSICNLMNDCWFMVTFPFWKYVGVCVYSVQYTLCMWLVSFSIRKWNLPITKPIWLKYTKFNCVNHDLSQYRWKSHQNPFLMLLLAQCLICFEIFWLCVCLWFGSVYSLQCIP